VAAEEHKTKIQLNPPHTMTLEQFLDKHNACLDGRVRAAVFASLEDAWQNCTPADLIWVATRPGVLPDREIRMFAVFCARSVQHLLKDPRSRDAITVAERHANGEATDDELRSAYAAACAACAACATCAADDKLRSAYAAACAAHAAAAYAAAHAAHAAAAYAAAREQQAAWLRKNTKPNFS
jgi:hypothetical protein